MKNLIIIFFVFISIFYFTNGQHVTYCPDDCPEVQWNGPFTISCSEVCPGLTASCEFEYRKNTCEEPSICQFRIVSNISFEGNFTPSCDMEKILINLTECTISQKIGLCDPDVSITVEFFKASCWKWDGPIPIDPNDPLPNMVSCYGTGCCKATYTVTKLFDGQGNFIGYDIRYRYSTHYGPDNCDPNDPGCYYDCIN
ncbi:MAG: hypothetical protein A2X61_14385 [Ignavibacteria bacterium GWB2_35_12]|nr:MAG: hypothetical protein A2X63_04535 [Ignavibacteria bacterium GWA2_35_8]OGU41092.1 MAG: hypothetical protein A2X61_14385 [Ignavibacteria bacterium GWB2_35_12]OGU88116.1 MAG: hypothetical protein A2220_05630 [Ignavibacteria bacterium RIFOXYA2_FULL_35_10]OGV22909.1 MAG: hypothetical protein A2475_10550 [Ignavibacteria bacterium RIFOXYC2_FULL_35_21]